MLTRLKNKKTLREYAQYLTDNHYENFLLESKEEQLILSNIENVPMFTLKKLTFELTFDEPSSDLNDVFNHVVPDEKIPYICYTQGDEFFAKIYEKAVFYEEWLKMKEKPSPNKEVFFRIQSNEENFICWNNEKVTFSFELSEITTLGSIDLIMEKIKTELIHCVRNAKLAEQLKGSVPKIVYLGGRFTLSFTLEPAIFSAYVTNDPIAQKYLFFDEYQKFQPYEIKTTKNVNTILTKKYIIVFFDILEPKGTLISWEKVSLKRSYGNTEGNPLTSVKLTITSDSDNKNINVRILKVSSLDHIKIISQYFIALLDRLKSQRENIIKQYETVGLVLPAFSKKALSQTTSLSKLQKLQDMDPPLFKNYARTCQKSKQPIGIKGSSAKVDRYLDQYQNYFQNKDGPFKLNYSYGAKTKDEVQGDNWYVCVPPHKGTDRIYPYLIDTDDPQRPFIPCCGKGDDNTKLKEWLQKGKREKKVPTSSIMQPDKILRDGVKGTLPLGIKEAWADTGDNAHLRLGVKKGPKSFISCLSLALNRSISHIQNSLVGEIKTFRTQETFGYTPVRLGEIIQNEHEYVDPGLFLGAAQNVLGVRVFLYAITEKFPKGDIAHPRTAFAYLPPLETFNRSVVIIIQQDTKPPQCELIISQAGQKLFKPGDPLVKTCKTILLRASRVYMLHR